MRLLILIFIFFISGCVHQSAEQRTKDFYQQYLHAYADGTSEIKDDSSVSCKYIATDTARRLMEIHAIPEQEITGGLLHLHAGLRSRMDTSAKGWPCERFHGGQSG